MCYVNTAIFNYIIWGGNACPYGAPGSLWFKAQTWSEKLIVRFFIVQLVGIIISYGAKIEIPLSQLVEARVLATALEAHPAGVS